VIYVWHKTTCTPKNSLLPGVKLTWKVASQTGRLASVHAQAIKPYSMPLQSTIKLYVWAGISIKTFGTKKFEELNCARECPRFYLLTLERYDILCCQVFQLVIF
jgi:hypothetical protein